MRVVIPGAILLVLGIQTIFSSFFLSVLGIRRRGPAVAARAMSVEERERAFFDRHYQALSRNPAGFALRVRRELAALRRLTGERRLGRLISVGCGDGPFECLLAPHAESVLGIDVSSTAIERARARAAAEGLANVEFRCQAASALPAGESFDGVACVAFLHHVAEPELPALLASLFARLRPGGFLFAQEPSRRGLLRAIGRGLLGGSYDRYHSADERELDPERARAGSSVPRASRASRSAGST